MRTMRSFLLTVGSDGCGGWWIFATVKSCPRALRGMGWRKCCPVLQWLWMVDELGHCDCDPLVPLAHRRFGVPWTRSCSLSRPLPNSD